MRESSPDMANELGRRSMSGGGGGSSSLNSAPRWTQGYDFGIPHMPGFTNVPVGDWKEADIQVDFETCRRSLTDFARQRQRPAPRRLKDDIFWLHFPKCGTSFGSALVGFVCQAQESPYINPNNPQDNCEYCGRGPGKRPG